MPGRGDLGFPGWALALVLLLGPAVVLLARRRWRIAVARRAEVLRLAALAAEEAERAEVEASLVYVVGSAGEREIERPRCAVCLSPTTTRCARCKAVRYCSGKCQIIDWRQGHKDECYPPQIYDHHDTQISFADGNGGHAEESGLCDNSRTERTLHDKPVETFTDKTPQSEFNCSAEVPSKDGHIEDMVCSSGMESTSDSSKVTSELLASSSSCSAFSGIVDTSDDAPCSEDPLVDHRARLREPLVCNMPNNSSEEAFTANQVKLAQPPPSEFVSAKDVSCSNDLEQKIASSKCEKVEEQMNVPCGASPVVSTKTMDINSLGEATSLPEKTHVSNAAKNVQDNKSVNIQSSDSGSIPVNAGTPLQVSSKLSGHNGNFWGRTLSEDATNAAATSESTSQPVCREKAASVIFSDSPSNGNLYRTLSEDVATVASKVPSQSDHREKAALGIRESDCLTKGKSINNCKEARSVSSAKYSTSIDEGLPVSREAQPTIEKPPVVPIRSLSNKTSALYADYDLKAYMQRVVQQCKSSKFSRHYSSGFGNDTSGKGNYKMLFPYDLFIKLYNSDKVDMRPCGLINCGNSCYANVVLQCLAFTRPLTTYLLEGLHTKICAKTSWCFMCEFESLLQKAKQGKSPLSPIGILSHIEQIGNNLGHGREEDAHEFLRHAVDVMQSICVKEAGENAVGPLVEETTLIQLIFGGYLRSRIKCMRCQGKSERHERMMDLTVEIHGDIGSLEEALARFTTTEVLDGENKYQCNRCKSYERAKKKLTVSEAPNVLTIALKRFQSGKFGKLNKAVRFPEYLNLAPYMSGTDDKSPVYRLYGVVVHLDIMNAAFSGHYVCYVKSTQGKWYKIDDSKVKTVEFEKVLSKGAYMLFYARCSPRAPSLLRKGMSHEHGNMKKSRVMCHPKAREGEISKAVPTISSSHPGSLVAQNRSQQYPHQTSNDRAHFEPFDFVYERFLHPRVDTSSDSSSLLSCSDEGSWTTESTRDSTSTDEYSDYIFGDSSHSSWNSPYRYSEDSDGFTFSPSSSRHSSQGASVSSLSYPGRQDHHQRRGISYEMDYAEADGVQGERFPFLNADSTKVCRKLTEECSSGRYENWANPDVVKSSVTMRKSRKDRTTRTVY